MQREISEQSKQNPKKFWKYVKSKTNMASKIADLATTDPSGERKMVSNDGEKAEILAEQFSRVFVKETIDVPQMDGKHCETKMEKLEISEAEILKKLEHLQINKSPGPDQLYPRVLREVSKEIVKPLQVLFSKSLETGLLPSDWLSADITAIYKKGCKNDASNYRPVSLTCIVCKIMESHVRDHIMNHLDANKLLSNRQYGFRKGRSTMLQLLKVLDDWTNSLEKGRQINVVYTDFEKAFDKVPHKRLVEKLRGYGVRGDLLNWIAAFLADRRQRVRVNGKYSGWSRVISGIPQGSILGPLLFVIYINDLPEILEGRAAIALFADDAKIYGEVMERSDVEIMQGVVDDVDSWCRTWMIKINSAKCKAMTMGGRQNKILCELNMDGAGQRCALEQVAEIRDLGVLFDMDLKFEEHINEKINKAYSMLGIIKRNFKYLDEKSFVMLYKSMVRSHLEYAVAVWYPIKKGLIEALEKVQRRATKIIQRCKKMTYEDRLRHLKLPTLKFRRIRGDLIEAYKMLTGVYEA